MTANRLIQDPSVLLSRLGLRFHQGALVRQALTHRSAHSENNERLEFLGDAVLGFVIAEQLYHKFTGADEGVLSRLRASLVNQTTLAELARSFQLGDALILGSGELKSGGYRRDSILSDALEALIGALLLDQGMDACRRFILQLFTDRIEGLSLEDWKKDPKTRLQEAMQACGQELPSYQLMSVAGQPHDQNFRVSCQVSLINTPSEGLGSSRKRAEQAAAEQMLERLQEAGCLSSKSGAIHAK